MCVIELDDRTHYVQKDALRDSWVASAGIPTLRFHSRRKPTEAQIAKAVADSAA